MADKLAFVLRRPFLSQETREYISSRINRITIDPDHDGKLENTNIYAMPEGYVISDLTKEELPSIIVSGGHDLERTTSAFTLRRISNDEKKDSLIDWAVLIRNLEQYVEARQTPENIKLREEAVKKYVVNTVSDYVYNQIVNDSDIDLADEDTLTFETLSHISEKGLLMIVNTDQESGKCPTGTALEKSSDPAFTLRRTIEELTIQTIVRCSLLFSDIVLPEEIVLEKIVPFVRIVLFMVMLDSPGYSSVNPLQRYHRSTSVSFYCKKIRKSKDQIESDPEAVDEYTQHALMVVEGSSLLANIWIKHLVSNDSCLQEMRQDEIEREKQLPPKTLRLFEDLGHITRMSHCMIAKHWVRMINSCLAGMGSSNIVEFSTDNIDQLSMDGLCSDPFFRKMFMTKVPRTLFVRHCNTLYPDEKLMSKKERSQILTKLDGDIKTYTYFNYVYCPNDIYRSGIIYHEFPTDQQYSEKILTIEGSQNELYDENKAGTWCHSPPNLLGSKADFVVMKVARLSSTTINRIWSATLEGNKLPKLKIGSKYKNQGKKAYLPRKSYNNVSPDSYMLDSRALEALELTLIGEFYYYPKLPTPNISTCLHVLSQKCENVDKQFFVPEQKKDLNTVLFELFVQDKELKDLNIVCHSAPYCSLFNAYLLQNHSIYFDHRTNYLSSVRKNAEVDAVREEEKTIEMLNAISVEDEEIENFVADTLEIPDSSDEEDQQQQQQQQQDLDGCFRVPTFFRPYDELKTFCSTRNYPIIVAGIDLLMDILHQTGYRDEIMLNMYNNFFNPHVRGKWVDKAIEVLNLLEDRNRNPLVRAVTELPLHEMWHQEHFSLYSDTDF